MQPSIYIHICSYLSIYIYFFGWIYIFFLQFSLNYPFSISTTTALSEHVRTNYFKIVFKWHGLVRMSVSLSILNQIFWHKFQYVNAREYIHKTIVLLVDMTVKKYKYSKDHNSLPLSTNHYITVGNYETTKKHSGKISQVLIVYMR